MAATSGKFYPVGLRYAVAYALNANGRPNATATTVYEGVEIAGPKTFTLNVPEPRKIQHKGNDRVLAVDFLPPQEGISGELAASVYDYTMISLLSGITQGTVGEAKEVAYMTSKQGSEPQVGLMLYQQAEDYTTGARRWRAFVLPKAILIPRPGGAAEQEQDYKYTIAPQIVNARLWGAQLVLATDGYTDCQIFEYMTEGKPHIASFLADGTADDFLFSTDYPALNASKIAVYKNGTVVSTGVTKNVTGLAFTAAPTLNDEIVVFYEA